MMPISFVSDLENSTQQFHKNLVMTLWLKILSFALCFIGIMLLRQLWRKAVSVRHSTSNPFAKSIEPISTRAYNTMNNLGLVVLPPKKTPHTATVIFCHGKCQQPIRLICYLF